jgi:hypothetical protein
MGDRSSLSRASVRLVDEYEVLVHALGIDGALEYEQVLRPDDAMLHAGLEMELVARRERFDPERLIGRAPGQDKACAFLDLKPLILLFVRLESQVSAPRLRGVRLVVA